jgi:RNA 3'-terminal phosphate cyclase
MSDKKIQFCHVRDAKILDLKNMTPEQIFLFAQTATEINVGLAPTGGMTVAVEVPTVEEFEKLNPSLEHPVYPKIGIAHCSKTDNYCKKTGRELAISRLKEEQGYVTARNSREVQVLFKGLGITIILRKHPHTNHVYFEEVVVL